ncbi:MAG: AI-2E family transporter [Lentisphaeria bacterium]|nr:AI-2E family transporter [Lentisphaeria bacterium]
MISLERIKQFLDLRQSDFNLKLKEKFSAATQLLLGTMEDEAGYFRLAFQSLVHPLLLNNNRLSEKSKMVYRHLLEDFFNIQVAEKHLAELPALLPLPEDEAVAVIRSAENNDPLRTAEFLIVLGAALPYPADTAYISRVAEKLGMDKQAFADFTGEVMENKRKKQRLRNSSRSIIAVLIIILIFFLTAKYLQSVIFGVLLACLMLPLEKFIERRLQKRRGIFFLLTASFSYAFYPLKRLSILLSRKGDTSGRSITRHRKQKEQSIIRQSVILTALIAALIIVLAGFGISKLTGHYMKNLQRSIRVWETTRQDQGSASGKYNYAMEKLRENFESIPLVKTGLDRLEKIINDPGKRDQIISNIIRSNGGIVNITGGVVGGIAAFLADILLTIFFSLLFLLKFAEYSRAKSGHASGSEYIVRNFFNGIWLPGADETLIQDTCKTINGIIFRLRIWLKGYLTLIMVDSTFYTTCFFFLGVPFFLPLGLIAGCGIALPYLGPVISCLLTVLVTIAAGAATGEMLLVIVICYLIYNGIIEQFILYPAVIGESLGLSTLETIIVVLLGAIFAGIPGMIFALPAASVAKYLVPQIYHGFTFSERA